MSYSVPQANLAANDTFQVIIDSMNLMANLFTYSVITVNGSANGSVTTGNAYVNGTFGALNLSVGTLSGGNGALSNTLTVTSNVVVGNSTINAALYTNGAVVATSVKVGSTTVSNTGAVNAVSVSVGNVSVNSTMVAIGGANVAIANAALKILANNVLAAVRGAINLIPGTGVSIAISDDAPDGQANVTITCTLAQTAFVNIAGLVGPSANAQALKNALTITLSDVSGTNTLVNSVAGIIGPTVSNAALQSALNLGGASHLNIGTTTGTVAAGDDSRITGALQSVPTASAADVQAGTSNTVYNTPKSLSQSQAFQPLTSAATIAWNMANGYNASVTLGQNATLGVPTNPVVGQSYILIITQDATGSRTLAYSSCFDFGSIGTPTLSTAAGKADMLVLFCVNATTPLFYASMSKGF